MKMFSDIVGMLGMLFVISLIVSLPVMLLWNWLAPMIFGLTTLTWLQSWGVLLLSGVLFKTSSSIE